MPFAPEDVFKQIIDREIPAEIIYEDEDYIAFKDIQPKAQVHVLIVPKANGLITAMDVSQMNVEVFGGMFMIAKYVSDMLDMPGYKLHMNVGEEGGQMVPRVHLHMLSSDYICPL